MTAADRSVEIEAKHSVYVQRFAGGLANEFDSSIETLKNEINAILISDELTELRKRNFNAVIRELENVQQGIYTSYTKETIKQLELFAEHEVDFEIKALDDVITSDSVLLQKPAPVQLWSAIKNAPLVFPDSNDVVLLEPLFKNWSNAEIKRVSSIIKTGVVLGQTNKDLAAKITGKDGVLNKRTLQQAKAVVRTATNHISSMAREKTMEENDDVVIGYEWISTLDNRTSSTCRSLDGRVFKWKDKYKPKPPIHVNCRSATAPVFDKRFNFDDIKTKRGAAGSSGRGQVDAKTDYYSWLKKQSKAFQNDVLGATRAKLLRDGGLTSKEFAALTVDKKFRPLTLDEMKKKNKLVFEKAGI